MDTTTAVPVRDFLSIEQFARELHVPLATAYQWFAAGHASKKCPKFMKAGKHIRIRRDWRDESLPSEHPSQPKLSRLRRQDLRHAAVTAWLRAGVEPKVVQEWSGHMSLKVMLDVYTGVLKGDHKVGRDRYEAYLNAQMPAE